MNYYIEKHDIEIILDALELLHTKMKKEEDYSEHYDLPYRSNDVDNLFQSFVEK